MSSSRLKPGRRLQASEISRSTVALNRARCFGSQVSRSHKALSKRSRSGLREDLLQDALGRCFTHSRPVPHSQLVLKHELRGVNHLSRLDVIEFRV